MGGGRRTYTRVPECSSALNSATNNPFPPFLSPILLTWQSIHLLLLMLQLLLTRSLHSREDITRNFHDHFVLTMRTFGRELKFCFGDWEWEITRLLLEVVMMVSNCSLLMECSGGVTTWSRLSIGRRRCSVGERSGSARS